MNVSGIIRPLRTCAAAAAATAVLSRQLGACGGGDAVVEVSAQLAAAGAACGLHVAEAHAEIRVGFVDGDADEGVVVVDADLGDVTRVVANGDAPADKRGKRRGEVPLALEVDPVALHGAALRHSQQEPVELHEALRHPRQPAVTDPRCPRSDTELLVRALVVGGDERPDGRVEAGQVEHGCGTPVAGAQVTGEEREQLGGDGAEEPLDLPAALGTADSGVNDPDPQLRGGVLEVAAGVVGAVVDVEDVGDPAHRPAGIGLPPDRLPERQCGVHRRRGAGEDGVPADRAGVVVHDHGQPGAVGLPADADDEEVELGVVGLPRLVRALRPAPVHELVPIPLRRRPLQSHSHQRGVERLNDLPHRGVARGWIAPAFRVRVGDPVQGRDARPGLGQRQALDERNRRRRGPPPSSVHPRLRVEGGDAAGAVELVPALQGPGADASGAGESCERDLVFDMQP